MLKKVTTLSFLGGGGANSFVPFISYAFDIHPSIPTVRGVQRNSRGGETEGANIDKIKVFLQNP